MGSGIDRYHDGEYDLTTKKISTKDNLSLYEEMDMAGGEEEYVKEVFPKQENNIDKGDKYKKTICDNKGNSVIIDVYDVLVAFEITCPAMQHSIKKLLCAGNRGHKDKLTDLDEAKHSIDRAKELMSV